VGLNLVKLKGLGFYQNKGIVGAELSVGLNVVRHLHIIALNVSYTYSHHYTTCFIHLTFYLAFTSSYCHTIVYHD
jgi:hypothetical protein